ncbi:hypothetical protein K2173_023659 [Erythroxylum novogranatense]|uniref:Uncharacterized protein n=1 Tax=Erythroxylum novogranatense TaxID=1862640 RepID=A0AAV8TR66_9ROSI|nr:hypothetical protein K2173_023659 [Erythroxylum novogranatense]
MLQWMGGSRRKVSTSRKSTYKKQKQYFEQKRRQQLHQNANLTSFGAGSNGEAQTHTKCRSLDVLNFLNFSTDSQECGSHCPDGKNDEISASAVKYCINNPPIILANCIKPADSLEPKEARNPSDHQVETVSPNLHVNQNGARNGVHEKLDPQKIANQQEFSLLDLLEEGEPNGKLENSLIAETHVAFSIEGLGKVGAETPVHSPQPNRCTSYVYSPVMAYGRLNTSNSISRVVDDPGLGADTLMQETCTNLGGSSLEFLTGIEDLHSKPRKKLCTFKDHLQFNGQSAEIWDSFNDRKEYFSTVHDSDITMDAHSGLLNTNFLYGREADMFGRDWPYQMDSICTDFQKPNYAIKRPHWLKKREDLGATQFNILDTPDPTHQMWDDDFDFLDSERARCIKKRHRSARVNFCFGDVADQPDCFKIGSGRDNLSSLSEESCSSTGVKSSSIRQSTFGSSDTHSNGNNILGKETQPRNMDDMWKADNIWMARKSTRMPAKSDTNFACNLNSSCQETIGPSGTWLHHEHCSAARKLGLSSACQASETEYPFSATKLFTGDSWSSFTFSDPHLEAKYTFNVSRADSPVKCGNSGSFQQEDIPLCQPCSHMQSQDFPTYSRVGFCVTKQKFCKESPDSRTDLVDQSPTSSYDAPFLEETLSQDLSAQKSASKDGGQSKFQQVNLEKVDTRKKFLDGKKMGMMDALETGENGGFKEEGISETSSSVQVPSQPENLANEKVSEQNVEVPLPQNWNQENGETGGKKVITKAHMSLNHSSSTVTILESRVLQFVWLQKALKGASTHTP